MVNVGLSGVMITFNEEEYVEEILTQVVPHVDEMVVLDGGSTDGTLDILQRWKEEGKIRLFRYPFKDHFGDQKNMVCSLALGRWIFLVDPDERFEEGLLEGLREDVAKCEEGGFGCVSFPRKNFLDGVWVKNKKTYPDPQFRLFRSYCRWVFRVHEELVGWKGQLEHRLHFLHHKTSARQAKQNIYYKKLIATHASTLHFMEKP